MSSEQSTNLYPAVAPFIAERVAEFDQISDDRKRSLQSVADYIVHRFQADQTAQLTFICTHNSRRSQLSQVWAQIAADYYGLKVATFSGGTETTAFNPRAIDCLRRAGLQINVEHSESENPVYEIRHSTPGTVQTCFSKVYDGAPNPISDFCAVMTCSHADEACPIVTGCQLRVPVMYDDPKLADDAPNESAVYDERSKQICREMLYIMSKVSG